MHDSLAMQSMSMRLSTVSEVGDIVNVLAPARNVMASVSTEMSGILPQASQELGNIGSLLGDIMTTTCQGSEMPIEVGHASPEAEAILQEAEFTVETRLKEQLPEIIARKSYIEPASIET